VINYPELLSILPSHLRDIARKIDFIDEDPRFMAKDEAQRLAKTLRKARESAALSVRQLETQSGVPKTVISRFEHTGTGSAQNLLDIARALELSASDLFAQAGRPLPKLSNTLPAMLRAEYDLPPEAIKEVQRNIEVIARRYRDTSDNY
jgi:transcriptional regulator with XRE-family HTH domain